MNGRKIWRAATLGTLTAAVLAVGGQTAAAQEVPAFDCGVPTTISLDLEDDTGFALFSPWHMDLTTSVSVPAGRYTMTLVGREEYYERGSVTQLSEQFYVALPGGALFGPSNDIPDRVRVGVSTPTGVLGPFSTTGGRLVIKHMALVAPALLKDQSANSVNAIDLVVTRLCETPPPDVPEFPVPVIAAVSGAALLVVARRFAVASHAR